MSAHSFIDELYQRDGYWNRGLTAEKRRITPGQYAKLLDLIGRDEDGGALTKGMGGSLVWMPRGRNKWVITEELGGKSYVLTKMMSLAASDSGRLFPDP